MIKHRSLGFNNIEMGLQVWSFNLLSGKSL